MIFSALADSIAYLPSCLVDHKDVLEAGATQTQLYHAYRALMSGLTR